MKPIILPLLLLSFMTSLAQGEDQEGYIEFNDRRNVVHGIYAGFGTYFGEIDGKNTFHGTFRLAYVANRQLEVGFVAVGFYSQQDLAPTPTETLDLVGGYAGLHVEPILFGQSKLNLSFPLMMGAGAVVLEEDDYRRGVDLDMYTDDWDEVFVVEPGINLLYNLSRFVQLELGTRYRFSTNVKLNPDRIRNINGFSAGFALIVGIFNMGRNRYKKHLGNEKEG